MATDNDNGDEAGATDKASLAESIAQRCRAAAREDDNLLFDYLVDGRKLSKDVVRMAIDSGALGLSLWHHPDMARGAVGYGGPAAAFVVRDRMNDRVMAVDMRYVDSDTNGGKSHCSKGETVGFPWAVDWKQVERARVVYVVDSAINALSVQCTMLPGSATIATRGLANVARIDWSFLRGKSVISCLGNDAVAVKGPGSGYCPGQQASWQLHEILTGLDISCLAVDQGEGWLQGAEPKQKIRDTNEFLQLRGWLDLAAAMKQLEEWLVPGLPSFEGHREGRQRLFLPVHDLIAYRKYRVQPDFTRQIDKELEEKDQQGRPRYVYSDGYGFRIAALARVQISSPTSTMTGDADQSPTTVFAASVQTPRHGPVLLRQVMADEKLHNIDVWKKMGPVFSGPALSRALSIWERASSIGARRVLNFVGVAWLDGKPVVNEGPDCFFQNAAHQCPYHALVFPSGRPEQGAEVLRAYQKTFRANAAAIPLVWGLGAHLKAFLGFWPHFVLQAEKGSGKSTLIKRLERSIAMTMFSRQSMQTEFRMLTSMSYTSHPVGWEEISAQKVEMIHKAVANLQECYQYSHTRRGSDMLDFLLCAPVMLAGEDVPVEGLTGKVVRCQLTKSRRGPLMPDDLPIFPVKQWLQFLTTQSKARVMQLQGEMVTYFASNCVAAADAGAERMVTNYAALATAWQLLCEFTGLHAGSFSFLDSLVEEMNAHIVETTSDRQPWALVIDKFLGEIASKQFRYPFAFAEEDQVRVLLVRTSHVMMHLSQSNNLRPFWDSMSIKSDRALKQQLVSAKVLVLDPSSGKPIEVEKTIHGQRNGHMVALDLKALERFGLYATEPVASEPGFVPEAA